MIDRTILKGALSAISVDHERSILYTASRDGEIGSWDFDGVGQQRYVGHADRIQALALSGDGSTLASGGVDYKVIVWDTVSGENQLVLDAHIGPIVDLSFGEDGCLYSTSLDHTVRVWGSDYATTGASP